MIGSVSRIVVRLSLGIVPHNGPTQAAFQLERKIKRSSLILVAVLLSTTPAIAVSAAIKSECRDQRLNLDQKILSCTRVIDDKGESKRTRFAAYVSRARAYFAKQEWDSSIVDYEFAIQMFPSVAEPYNERGVAYDRKGNRERAIADYSAAIQIDPSNSLAYGNRGLAYYKNGAYDLAIADFNEAIRLDEKYSVAYNGRGVAYSKKGELQKAIADFTEAIRLNRSYANAYNNRAIAHSNIGHFDQAITDLNVAIQLEDRPDLYNELAWIYFKAGQAKAALPYANHALRVKPDYANAYDTRGSIFEALGDHVSAVADFKKALSLDPSIASSAAALARLAQNDLTSVTFSEVVHFVEQQGWRTNLGDMCEKFELPQNGGDCFFQQISVQETEGRRDPRGLNVPATSNSGPPYVLIFHLSPLVGEFFVASPDGVLMRAFVRFKGTGYNRVSNEDVREEFNKDLAYWTKNFFRLKKGLETSPSEKK